MDNFKIIYKMLVEFEKAMDDEDFAEDTISHTTLGISRNRWIRIMGMLSVNEYVDGIEIVNMVSSNGIQKEVVADDPQITLKGLEYLSENSLMAKAARAAKGIVDIVT